MARLDGQRLGERLQRPLAGGVGADDRHDESALDAGDENQSARASFAHGGQHTLHHPQGAEGVELEEGFDLGDGYVLQGRADRRARVADEHVDLSGVTESLVDTLLIGDIEAQTLVDGEIVEVCG